MSDAWKNLDLEGGGLQSVNATMARLMRHRKTAYLLWLIFCLGAHRFYLKSSGFGFGYMLVTIAVALLFFFTSGIATWLFALEMAFALYDLYWIDRRVDTLNKALRIRLFLRSDQAPPADYRGRYTDDHAEILSDYIDAKNQEQPADRRVSTGQVGTSKKYSSFSEQEKLLREFIKNKESPKNP